MRALHSLSLVAALTVAAACQQQASPLSEADQAALRAVVDSFTQRVQRTDWPAVASLFATDGHFMPPNQVAVAGRDNILAWMRAFPPISAFQASVDEVRGQGDVAYVRGHYMMMFTPPGATAAVPDTGKFLTIHWRQPDGSWPIVADIFNSDIPMAPPAK